MYIGGEKSVLATFPVIELLESNLSSPPSPHSTDRPTKERNYSIRATRIEHEPGLDTVGSFFHSLGKPADVYNFFTDSSSSLEGVAGRRRNVLSLYARFHTNIGITWEESNEPIDRLEKPRHAGLLYFRME